MSVAKALTLVLGKSKLGWEARDTETIIIMSSHPTSRAHTTTLSLADPKGLSSFLEMVKDANKLFSCHIGKLEPVSQLRSPC